MIEGSRATDTADREFVAFRATGERAEGEFRCAECGYGVAVFTDLPPCPMCAGTVWEEAAWSPFWRAGDRP